MRGFIGGTLILIGFLFCGAEAWPFGVPLIIIGLIIWLKK